MILGVLLQSVPFFHSAYSYLGVLANSHSATEPGFIIWSEAFESFHVMYNTCPKAVKEKSLMLRQVIVENK